MKRQKRDGEVGLCTLLFIVFLVLKLTGVITWSWWWVTAPLWVPIALIGVVFLFIFLGALFSKLFMRR